MKKYGSKCRRQKPPNPEPNPPNPEPNPHDPPLQPIPIIDGQNNNEIINPVVINPTIVEFVPPGQNNEEGEQFMGENNRN